MTVYRFRDEHGEIIVTPCCSSPLWIELYMITALCPRCGEAHTPTDLGAVEVNEGELATSDA